MMSHRRLRIAIVDEELPYPLTSGKRIRTLNLLLRLADRHQITYICHRSLNANETRHAKEFFRDHGMDTVVADRAPPGKSVLRSGPKFYAQLAANILSPLPYLVAANRSIELKAVVDRYASSHPVDVWQCEWTPYAEMTGGFLRQPRVVVAHNVESTIWQRYYETETHLAKRWYIKHQWRKLAVFEREAFANASRVIAVSECDAARIRTEFQCSHVDVVDNGVDTAYFHPTGETREPYHILFLGSLDWRPNLDAVRILLAKIFPAVRRSAPSARLTIVGRNPPSWLEEEATRAANVDLHCDVPDVRPFLNRCSVMTVPLRIGGGSRLKILEALACGLPVVSTAIGAEGLRLERDLHYVEANTTEQMADSLLGSMRVPEAAVHALSAAVKSSSTATTGTSWRKSWSRFGCG